MSKLTQQVRDHAIRIIATTHADGTPLHTERIAQSAFDIVLEDCVPLEQEECGHCANAYEANNRMDRNAT